MAEAADAGERLGADRGAKQYRIRSLDDSGAPLAFGSDWPVSSGAPLDGIAVAVSRGGWTPQELLTVERALSAYTAGVVAGSANTALTIDGSLPLSALDMVPSMILVVRLAALKAGPRY